MRGSPVRPVNVPVAGTALFLIDVINDLDFKDSGGLVAQAEPMAVRLSVLKRRAAAAGVPCVYVNDNFSGAPISADGGALHVQVVSGTPCLAPPAADEEGLFRAQAEAFGVL